MTSAMNDVEVSEVGGPASEVRGSVGRHLEMIGAWKAYERDSFVVSDVSFTLPPGQFLTLLGPSGSGKTTILMMIAGFELPTRGEIRVNGRDIARLPPERRNFGIVFQGYALFPHMPVLENVEFALRMKRQPRSERRRRSIEMLEKVGLAEFATRKPRELSGGQQQRVALARALVFEPDALLLDEPLGALDKKLREALQLEIKELQRRLGISVLLVTHDQDEAMMMSDHVAVMRSGRIVQLGSPAEVYQHPRTPFVASFLGETNLVPCVDCGFDGRVTNVRFKDGAMGRARQARDARERKNGGAIVISIRPERIRLLAPRDHADTVITGVVTDRTFLGREVRYVVHALQQQITVRTMDGRAPEIQPGTPIRLGWQYDDAQVLTDSREDF